MKVDFDPNSDAEALKNAMKSKDSKLNFLEKLNIQF